MRIRHSGFAGLALLSLAVGCGGSSSSSASPKATSQRPSASSPAPAKPDIDVALRTGDAPQNPYVAYGSLWVAAHHTKDVLRLDLTTGKILARIKTGAVEPGGIIAGHGLVWVVNYGAGRLLVGIDPHSNKIVRRTKLPGESCCQPAVLGSTVWVAAGGPDAPVVVGVDARSGRIVKHISGIDGPIVVDGQLWASRDGDTVVVNPRSGDVTSTSAFGTVLWDSPPVDGLAWGMQDGAAVGLAPDGHVARTVLDQDDYQLSYSEGMAITSGPTVWAVSEISLWRIDPGAKAAVLATGLDRDIHSIAGDGNGGVWVADFDGARMQHFPA
jgi:hypothetical protein